nr:probable polyamine oxidase 4 [Ipomoea batatas]
MLPHCSRPGMMLTAHKLLPHCPRCPRPGLRALIGNLFFGGEAVSMDHQGSVHSAYSEFWLLKIVATILSGNMQPDSHLSSIFLCRKIWKIIEDQSRLHLRNRLPSVAGFTCEINDHRTTTAAPSQFSLELESGQTGRGVWADWWSRGRGG